MKLSIFDSVFPRSQPNINHFSVGEQSMPYAFSQPVIFFLWMFGFGHTSRKDGY